MSNDPNWHRLPKEYDPGAPCICGHPLECHEPIDLAPCEECDCEAFDEKDYDPSDDEAFTDRDEWGRIR